jgi:glutaredoxin-related protein
MSQPYLFYSERCPHSKQIIETLKALNKAGLYKFVLVESLPRDQIPSFLKKVPTLYNPESKEVVVGKDIFGYISKPTNSRKELPSKESAVQPTGSIGDISAWGFEGSSRLSESYSSWDNPTSYANDGNSFYTFLGGPSVSQPSEVKEQAKIPADVSARLEAMENERKNEFSSIKRT